MVEAGKPSATDLAAIAGNLEAEGKGVELARELARLGLNQRAVCSCFAVESVAHAPLQRQRFAGRPLPPAALVPLLFVAGREVDAGRLAGRLGATFDALRGAGLLTTTGDLARASLTLLPIGDGLVACAPAATLGDTPELPGSGHFPDDSTFHLLGALPDRRVDSWLDIGTGNAAVPLARPGLAATITATDIDAAAVALARVGRALSGVDIELAVADLLTGAGSRGPWSLVTFNAPLPTTADGLIARFWAEVPALLRDDGEVIVHSQLDGHHPDELALPGQTTTVRYTPPEHEPAFGVTIWRPSGKPRRELVGIDLSVAHPHIHRRQFGLAQA